MWEWFYDAELDLLQQRSSDNTVWAYRRCLDAEPSHSVTQSQDVYARVGSLVPEHRMKGLPGRSGNVGAPTQNRLLFSFLVESCEVRSRV
jgi:hypothetical protein